MSTVVTNKLVRTEVLALSTSPAVRADVERTVAAYRRAVRALSGVTLVDWPSLAKAKAKSKCQAVESLFHATAKRPVVRYAVLDRMLGKMPSCRWRAAIEQAFGAVASFLFNYGDGLDRSIGGKARGSAHDHLASASATCSRRSAVLFVLRVVIDSHGQGPLLHARNYAWSVPAVGLIGVALAHRFF